ncbi:unnamed protein product [Ceutorhynchus assimilis]|uniref:Major facilitator superfamily (MFS) profile domain-containing protein n=1 Tax=Ceutorhynchus assimilis TaxID=467358 RepID=A0A9N9MRA8_9CUCU|nr:unnamed protein product [Ceutorhynchus assimilis]
MNQTNCSNFSAKPKVSKLRRCMPQIIAVSIKNILLLVYGLTMGMPAMLIPHLGGGGVDGETIVLGESGISWIGSLSFFSVPLGCFASGIVTKPFGRIRAMQLLCFLFIGAFLLFYFATQAWQVFLGLFLTGFTGGLLEAPTLIYAVEVTELGLRGALSSTSALAIAIGILQSFILGSVLPWRTMALINGSIPLAGVFLLFLIPEPPHGLIRKGQLDKARKSLAWLRGWTTIGNIEKEFQILLEEIEQKKLEKTQSVIESIKSYLKPTFLKPFGLVCLTFVLTHFGATQISIYAVNMFQLLHVPINSYHATILLGFLQMLGCFLLMILVRFLGKRLLSFIAQSGIFIGFLFTGIYAYSAGANNFDAANNLNEAIVNKYSWLPLAAIAAVTFCNCLMTSSLPWIIMGELYPSDIRDTAAGLSAAAGYYIAFLANKTFLSLINVVTLAGVFWINSCVALLGIVLMYFLLPETEGKHLLEITEHYAGRRKLSNNVRRQKGIDNKVYEGDCDSKL